MNNDNPILNNPYEEPRYHYNADIDGNLDYSQRLEGRRPYIGNIQIIPNSNSQSHLFNAEDLMNNNPDAKFINDLRIVLALDIKFPAREVQLFLMNICWNN